METNSDQATTQAPTNHEHEKPVATEGTTTPVPAASSNKHGGSQTPHAEQKIYVATHSGHHNKTPGERFGKVEASSPWRPVSITPLELIDHISAGKAWVGCHLNGGRSEASAGLANLIVLDIDGDLALDAFWAKPLVQRCCLFTATTCSHSTSEHRFRAVFRCDEHDNPRLHKAIYHHWLAALNLQLKDNSGEKPERLWFGNDAAAIQFGAGEPISWDIIEAAKEALAADLAKRSAPRPEPTANDAALDNERAAYCLRHLLRPSEDNEYNSYWSPVFNAAAATRSDAVREAFLEWHSKGHHSKKNKNVEKRFDRAGTKITPGQGAGQLLKLAKEQHGEQWWKQMPEDLQYGKGGGTTPKPPISLMRARSTKDIEPPQNLSGWNGGTSYKPPISLASSRSLADTLPPPDFGDLASFSDAAATGATDAAGTVPERVPSTDKLQELAKNAPPAVLFSHATTTPKAQPAVTTAARIRQLVELIYWLKIENIHRGPGGNALLSEEEADDQADEYNSELLAYPVFARQPERIEIKLLQEFRRHHGVVRRSRLNIKARHLFDTQQEDREPMIGGLMSRGCSYILYARQGVGKSKLAFLLCRAAVGTPGHNRFLDFKPVPQDIWCKERALYIASDGDDNAGADLRRYAKSMRQKGAQWLDYFDVIDGNQENQATRWRIDLYDMHLLTTMLDDAAAAGTPYRLVVIDSLKAVAPDGRRVGDQVITDYVDLINSICSPRNVTVLYIHHQSKENDNAQGAAGLVEMVHGVFRLKDENKQSFFCVDKTRLDVRGKREIPYQIRPNGDLRIAPHATDADDDYQGRELILRAFQQHYDKHLQRVADLPKTDPARKYPGIAKSEVMLLLRAAGPVHPSWKSARALTVIIGQMVKDGLLKRLKNSQAAIAGAEPTPRITTEQLQLKARQEEATTDGLDEVDDLPGW